MLAFAAALFTLVAVAAALMIPPEHLTAMLGHPASWTDYLRVALLATDLGLVAGAVGSSLEHRRTVQDAAYGPRERQRRQQMSTEPERATSG